ncbi:MAG: UDP-N-acetylglucosamine--N-acetylmuramyl-(pentapeptide) pyrophosphoryl-undecaprenol N-acetylglucosamine transferase [Holosporales bacterium]|jgi:UDP-N-acetylglucosamine--N-acetylmuramyl-(pentapeptide) pyrophosphoryl-undecaprenol N-acetylglucosamine transferase|nr:UDP-N-acetylglucosamine--N-acetylmuramyl-(pentapeptide) pyrophosphoryl-undecaprenol N-acetylglucosamine transferase [Holosporales bacterium]
MKNLYVLAAGGTGGHLFPAESLAQELKARGGTVVLFTDERAAKWVQASCFDRVIVSNFRQSTPKRQLRSKLPFTSLPFIRFLIKRGRSKLKKFIFVNGLVFCGLKSLLFFIFHRPRAVVGFGGYPSAPTVFAAQILGIRSVLHECNAIIGRANKILARKASAITTGFSHVVNLDDKAKHKQIFTGNPVRSKISALANVPYVAPTDCLRIFVVGGSQGAHLFANVVPYAMQQLKGVNVHITMQVGIDDIQRVGNLFKQNGIEAELAPFFEDIDEILARSHVVISRSGATSLAEFAARGLPSVLVPLKGSRDGDQLYNAMQFEANGASVLIQEQAFSPNALGVVLLELHNNLRVLEEMSQAAREMFVKSAVLNLAEIVIGSDLSPSNKVHLKYN